MRNFIIPLAFCLSSLLAFQACEKADTVSLASFTGTPIVNCIDTLISEMINTNINDNLDTVLTGQQDRMLICDTIYCYSDMTCDTFRLERRYTIPVDSIAFASRMIGPHTLNYIPERAALLLMGQQTYSPGDIFQYHIDGNNWIRISNISNVIPSWIDVNPQLVGRSVYVEQTGQIYFLADQKLITYDLENNTFDSIPTADQSPHIIPYSEMTYDNTENCLLTFKEELNQTSLWRFSLDNNQWQKLLGNSNDTLTFNFTRPDLVYRESAHSILYIRDSIKVSDSTYTYTRDIIQEYDLASGTNKVLTFFNPTEWTGSINKLVYDNNDDRLFMLRNENNLNFKIWEFNFSTNSWSFVTGLSEIPSGYYRASLDMNGKKIYISLQNNKFFSYSYLTNQLTELAAIP